MIVDDDKLLRFGLRRILDSAPGIRVVVECDGAEAVGEALSRRPDVALVDICMPDVDGLAVLRALLALEPAPAVAMLTGFGTDEEVTRALSAGARGFFLKDAAPRELIPGVRLLAAGGSALSTRVARSVALAARAGDAPAARPVPERPPGERPPGEPLSARERAVFELLPTGMTNAEIGERLFLSRSTVKDHVSAILGKLGAANRVQAAILAHRAADPRPDGGRGGPA
ncbi:response regulator transcription factor [Streptomyces sp. NPDC001941]|uniref:response regulator transcription factor n=1 Tax=Streptomyces sp. NPDC001941 TaxID=3154659 RepID=UPI00332E9CBC